MSRGRRPKPTKLKLLLGNPGKRRLPKDEPAPRVSTPSCPEWLSKAAKSEWKRIVPELEEMGLLTIADRAALASYCQAFAELEIATKLLDKEGRVVEQERYDRTGAPVGGIIKAHPAVKLQRDAFTRVKQFLVEFGLSPASRPKLAGMSKSDEPDPFEAFLSGKGKGKAV